VCVGIAFEKRHAPLERLHDCVMEWVKNFIGAGVGDTRHMNPQFCVKHSKAAFRYSSSMEPCRTVAEEQRCAYLGNMVPVAASISNTDPLL